MDRTRRAFLLLGGGATAATLGWWAGVTFQPNVHLEPPSGGPAPDTRGYVDYQGWMVTPADHTRIVAEQRRGETR